MHNKSIEEIQDDLQKKRISSQEITEHFIKSIEKHNTTLNAVVHLDKENAILEAKKIDSIRAKDPEKLSKMAGIPILNKDIFCTIGQPTTCCSKMLENYQSPFDATMIKNCRNAGMILLGKCSMDEFAMGGSNENSHQGPVKNPWNLEYVPGGSSGGSASAVAARITPLATGTDTGGSIRQPAAFCGITGLKPSYGVISRYGMVAFASSLDQAGPMAKSAKDCAYLLSTMASYDPENDMTSVQQKNYDYTSALEHSISGLKVGLPKQYFKNFADPQIEKLIQDALDIYKKMGVQFMEVDLPDVEHCISAYYTIAPCEASSNLARFDGNIYGYRDDSSTSIDSMYEKSRTNGFGNEVKRRILMGTYALSSGYSNDYYEKAQNLRNLIRHDFDSAWNQVDCIIAPSTPSTAFKLNELLGDPFLMYQQDVYTIPVNMAELPALSMPIGKINGLPIGLQIIGKKWAESQILNCAHQYQKVTAWHLEIPKDYE